MKSLSITTKITIWYTIGFMVIIGGFLTVLTYAGNIRAGEMARTRLVDSVNDASEEIYTAGENFIIDKDLEFYEDGVYISVYDDTGEIIEGRRPAELSVTPPLSDGKIEKTSDSNGEIWYIYDSRFDMEGKEIWVRGIVKDFAEGGTFSFILKIALIAFPAIAVLAAAGGYVITRRAFRPVRGILETVAKISGDGDLSRRIDIDESAGRSKDEIHNLAQTFNGMFDKLERSFEKEKQFTSDVSHELRTPLSVIISQSEYAAEDESYREKALGVINREAKRMAGLVSRLLTLARSDSGRLRLDRERIDLSDMCETVLLQQEAIAAEHDIKIKRDIEKGVIVYGDEAMLIRVILNLVDNAIKYGREGGYVKLSLHNESGCARCTVEDNGIGIGREELSRIWERFYRVDSARNREGEGLGLSMVDALVRAHGGHVEAESVQGEGSRFTVVIPAGMPDLDVEEDLDA